MKKLLTICLVLLLCVPAYATKIHSTASDKLGSFSGDGGAAQDDSAKASMDLAHTDLDALIRELGIVRKTNASVWYVDSGASGSANGTSWTNAEVTIEGAVADCTADAGDIILVAPGHSETLGTGADGVDLDKAGITVIGLGVGSSIFLYHQ